MKGKPLPYNDALSDYWIDSMLGLHDIVYIHKSRLALSALLINICEYSIWKARGVCEKKANLYDLKELCSRSSWKTMCSLLYDFRNDAVHSYYILGPSNFLNVLEHPDFELLLAYVFRLDYMRFDKLLKEASSWLGIRAPANSHEQIEDMSLHQEFIKIMRRSKYVDSVLFEGQSSLQKGCNVYIELTGKVAYNNIITEIELSLERLYKTPDCIVIAYYRQGEPDSDTQGYLYKKGVDW